MTLEGFSGYGVDYYESAALAHILDYHSVTIEGEPIDEAFCFGASGGITSGYAICPSIPGFNREPGIAIVGRYRSYLTGPDLVMLFFSRLGIESDVFESTDDEEAEVRLRWTLSNGYPALLWSSPPDWSLLDWPETLGNYRFVVAGMEGDEATCAGPYSVPVVMGSRTLRDSRSTVLALKNRFVRIDIEGTDPKDGRISEETARRAVWEGLDDAVGERRSPTHRSYGITGLEELARNLDNPKKRKGWRRAYNPETVYPALRDAYSSIEGSSASGGLLRPLYARFLWQAARLFGSQELAGAAEFYEDLGRKWTTFAGLLMPDRPPFRETRALVAKRRELWTSASDPAGATAEYRLAQARLDAMAKDFTPFGAAEYADFLTWLKEELLELLEDERIGAQEVEGALANLGE